jgi:hypothetical protein
MYKEGNGYPLWVPEPYSNRPAYLARGVNVGDVGYVTEDGAFETLFNTLLPADHPVNCAEIPDGSQPQPSVPEGFVPLTISGDAIRTLPDYHHEPSFIVSASAKAKSLGGGIDTTETM